jgi:hypothetical protein
MNKNLELWTKLQSFEIDDVGSDFTFTMRLARENGWSLAYAKRVVNEYKKFLYLSATENTPLTPSDEVDQAWHLHMLYTQSYWNDLCKNILGKNFHHGPTKGGGVEKTKYNNLYEKTLYLYREHFGEDAPSDIWPSTDIRFSNITFRRVNMADNIVINKKRVAKYVTTFIVPAVFSVLALFLMASKSENKEDETLKVLLYIVFAILGIFILRGIWRYVNRKDRGSNSSSSSSSSDSGCSIIGSFFGCSSDSGCSSSGCSSCGSGCSGCGGCS